MGCMILLAALVLGVMCLLGVVFVIMVRNTMHDIDQM
jgi:hypothetical protein